MNSNNKRPGIDYEARALARRKRQRQQPPLLVTSTICELTLTIKYSRKQCYLNALPVYARDGVTLLGTWRCQNVEEPGTRFRFYDFSELECRICNRCSFIFGSQPSTTGSEEGKRCVYARLCRDDSVQILTAEGDTPDAVSRLGPAYAASTTGSAKKNRLTFTRQIHWSASVLENVLQEKLHPTVAPGALLTWLKATVVGSNYARARLMAALSRAMFELMAKKPDHIVPEMMESSPLWAGPKVAGPVAVKLSGAYAKTIGAKKTVTTTIKRAIRAVIPHFLQSL